jgi:hypothetical protein
LHNCCELPFEDAAGVYGVVIAADRTPDTAATVQLRERMRHAAS